MSSESILVRQSEWDLQYGLKRALLLSDVLSCLSVLAFLGRIADEVIAFSLGTRQALMSPSSPPVKMVCSYGDNHYRISQPYVVRTYRMIETD